LSRCEVVKVPPGVDIGSASPKEGEVQLPSGLVDHRLLMAMSCKGCTCQPFYEALPPRRERMASILFAMAASEPDPVPVICAEDAVALARRLICMEALD
jgi:hypothetical protein